MSSLQYDTAFLKSEDHEVREFQGLPPIALNHASSSDSNPISPKTIYGNHPPLNYSDSTFQPDKSVPGINSLLSRLDKKPVFSPPMATSSYYQQPSRVEDQDNASTNSLLYGHKSKPTVGSKEWMRVRRENHKEVERKRRECINSNINLLGNLVPGPEKNKGGILNRVVSHINELREEIARLKEEYAEDSSHLQAALQDLSYQVSELREENLYLKTRLGGTHLSASGNLTKAT